MMMTNLFSMFDPSTHFLNLPLNWISLNLLMILIPNLFWMLPNNLNLIYNKLINFLFNEFKIITKKNISLNILSISLFTFIVINNFLGLFPYIFTSTSHLSINLFMALPLWMMVMTFSMIKKPNTMLTHLVPQGTPKILIMFMVLIETTSLMIRPITLTIRLTANMIAGHLLLTLLGNMGPKLMMALFPSLIAVQMILLTLEIAVSFIQAYVFAILITLYASEI